MKKIVVSIIAIFVIISIVMIPVYATNVSQENSIESTSTTNLVELKDKALNTLKDYQVAYGNDTYGFVAYVLNIVAVSAIYQYVIGIRKLDTQEKGFGVMIGIITVMVICQVLPLIFAIVVRGWRG